MKFIVAPVIILCFLLILSCKTTQPGGWRTVINKSPLEKIVTYHFAAFDSQDFGMVTGFAGQIFYTTDRAATWKQSANKSFDLFTLEINGPYIWACGEKGNVRVSKNSGMTFEPLKNFGRSEPDHCRFLSFVSPDNGWIASATTLASTADGGRTWSILRLPPDSARIVAIDLFADAQGVVMDRNAGLYFTGDGGKHWHLKRLVSPLHKPDLKVHTSPTVALRFRNPKQGMVIARIKNPFSYTIFYTGNGGNSWNSRILSTDRDYMEGTVYISRDMNTITLLDSEDQTVSVFTNR
ncbi:MAG: YCF48-related protein [Spirochaetia bacterium]